MSTKMDTSLRVSRVIQGDPDSVFRAWTEPEQLKRWSCPEGSTVEDAHVDLRVGGKYRIRMHGSEGQIHTAVGVYREIARPHRLVYTWEWEEKDHAVGETLVTVEFNDLDGSTEVVLIHELFPAAEATSAHEEGWTSCLNRLEGLFVK
jgi:uncharacterized protein YndB with AHSA1/START domain